MIKMCRDIFNKLFKRKIIIYNLKGETSMPKFLYARLTIAYVDGEIDGAKQLYQEYFSKKGLKKWKEATDALLKADEVLNVIVCDVA